MEDLQTLGTIFMKAIAEVPSLAIWALLILYAYKIVVVGSIYGVIRYVADKIAAVMMQRKAVAGKPTDLLPYLNGLCITHDNTVDELVSQLHRLRGRRRHTYQHSGESYTQGHIGKHQINNDSYIHKSTVDWLREAIDAKIELDEREAIEKGEKSATAGVMQ